MPDELNATAPQGQTAETAPAAPPGAEAPDGLKGQPEASPKEDGEQKPEGETKPADDAETRRALKRLEKVARGRDDTQRINERLLAILDKSVQSGNAPKVEAPGGPPVREDFETFEQYLEAKADFQVARKVQEIEQRTERKRAQEAEVQREATWKQKTDAVAAKYDDFEEVVFSDDLRISPVMAEAMKDCDTGPEIAYHLGKNPAEAVRISQLSPVAQVREIGKIEAQLNSKPVRQASKAPAPIDPVGGGKTGVGNLDTSSQAEYEALRKKQGAWWAGR